ncbi:uncharacterized protein LOC113283794 isoform X1 [Papaver somniferum]|nr:uncharacterized protein LOC113283794 isoform X1 [Papaver somniferum]XP_026388953.1 uncharacterized protein LOC113283794 isoform X1 [Papaver somniferum]XP_026388954.1 uncharacterized protein LOC113283794 isoform X1 [Papaver somniferum]
MDPTTPTDVHSSTVCQPDTAAPSHLGNSTVQLDEMASNDIVRCTILQPGLASPNELGSNTALQVCRMASNGDSSSTVIQVDTTTPTDLDTILAMDTAAPTNLDNSTISQAGSMVSNDNLSNTLIQVGETFPNDLGRSTRVIELRTINSNILDSSTVPEVDPTALSDLDRAGTENHLTESSREFSTMCRGNIMTLFLVYLITYLTRVPSIKNLCEQKFINEQAYKLVSIMLEQLDLTMNKSDIIDFFKTSSLMKTAITYGTTEVVKLSLQKFPYLLWSKMEGQTVVQTAIGERNEKVFNFICVKMEEDMDELNLHMNFCKKFKCLSSSPPPNPTKHLVSAMKHLLRRSLDSPPRVLVRSRSSHSSSSCSDLIRTKKNSDHNVVHLTRSGSCFSTLAR